MKIFEVFAVLMLALAGQNVSAQTWSLSADLWASPRSAQRVLSMPVLQELVQAWQKQPQQKLDLYYPGGEEGIIWANELKDWLVALGIPGSNIRIYAGSESESRIGISLSKPNQ